MQWRAAASRRPSRASPPAWLGPKPRRRLSRPMAAVAPSEPMPASIHSATAPALKPSSRAAYSTMIASDACRKICPYGDRPGERTQYGAAQIADNPSRISGTDARGSHFRRIVGPGTDAAQNPGRKEERQASSSIANGAVEPLDQCTGNSGPTSCAAESLTPILAFASTRLRAPTRFGHEDLVSRPAQTVPSRRGTRRIEPPPWRARRATRKAAPRAKARRARCPPYDDRKLGRAVHQDPGTGEERERSGSSAVRKPISSGVASSSRAPVSAARGT